MLKHQLSVIETSVLSLLPLGSERKISLSEIKKLIDLDTRSIQATIQSLIRKGVPVVAVRGLADGGIFIAKTDEEREIGLKSYESQAQEMLTRVKLVRQADLEHWHENVSYSSQERLGV